VVNRYALARLRGDPIDWRYKAFPPAGGVTPASVREQGWNVLRGDLLLPVLVLKERALARNIELMARYCERHGVSLAPHGKTTMSPELFERQLAAGAWGLTAATASQVRVYRAFGVERIVLANELVEPAAVRFVAAELAADPNFDFYCLVDSPEAVAAMTDALGDPAARPIQALVELGLPGGRTGCRSLEAAREVAAAVARSPVLTLAGVEGFEGIVHSDDLAADLARVDAFLDELRELVVELGAAGHFDGREEAVVTVGGSVYFDRVVERLARPADFPVRVVLRSGCYLTHDSGYYDHLSPLGERGPDGERLEPALEAWGAVLSRPEPNRAILGLGKRDVSHDIDLPLPLRASGREGPRDVRGSLALFDLNDQHAYLRLAADDPLAVGDLVGCGISHPCTSFDKWRLIPVVDDEYTVIDAVHTFF
jgi:D-serine deaminase-like pyridoxal phosphate-dependent protein